MKKANAQKNTLLKTTHTNTASKVFKTVFFSPAIEEFQIFFPSLKREN